MIENKCTNKLDYSKILGSKGNKPLIPIESLATSIITNDVFNDNHRNNLLKLSVKYFNDGVEKLKLDKNNIYLIYKGGNVVETTILNIYSLHDYSDYPLFIYENMKYGFY